MNVRMYTVNVFQLTKSPDSQLTPPHIEYTVAVFTLETYTLPRTDLEQLVL
jgi:hypothetical protein